MGLVGGPKSEKIENKKHHFAAGLNQPFSSTPLRRATTESRLRLIEKRLNFDESRRQLQKEVVFF